MTREEAITYLKVIWDRYKAEYEIERETLDAYHMAIEALSIEPSRKWETCFSCPLAKGCPQIQGKSNDEIAKYASEIPNGCPLSMSHNNDLISRAEAIERVELITKCEWDNNVIYRDEVIDALKFAPPAEAEPTVIRSRTFMPTKDFKEWAKRIREVNPNAVVIPCDAEVVSTEAAQGWIPCSERLPEIDETLRLCDQISEEVIGTDTYGNIRHVYLTNCGYLKPTFCTAEEGMSVDIVAWMPLPTPYKGGDTE